MSSESIVHVIDDDPALRDSLEFLFESAGLPVRVYESGRSSSNSPPLDLRVAW